MSTVGTTAGAAIGAAVGSAAPGIGTAVGGALGGIVGGMLGSSPGAEVTRQLSSTNPPWPQWRLDMFMKWLEEHATNTYRTGNGLWDRSSKGSASNWWDAYVRAFQSGEGWVEGTYTLDANYRPVQVSGVGNPEKRIVNGTVNADGSVTFESQQWWDGVLAWLTKYGFILFGSLVALFVLWKLLPNLFKGGGTRKYFGNFRARTSRAYGTARRAYGRYRQGFRFRRPRPNRYRR